MARTRILLLVMQKLKVNKATALALIKNYFVLYDNQYISNPQWKIDEDAVIDVDTSRLKSLKMLKLYKKKNNSGRNIDSALVNNLNDYAYRVRSGRSNEAFVVHWDAYVHSLNFQDMNSQLNAYDHWKFTLELSKIGLNELSTMPMHRKFRALKLTNKLCIQYPQAHKLFMEFMYTSAVKYQQWTSNMIQLEEEIGPMPPQRSRNGS